MNSIVIGIHVHAQPAQLRATLDSVRQHTASTVHVVLLPDGPDAETQLALRSLRDFDQFGTDQPQGAAACFNRLIAHSDSDLVVLLESGSIVGPQWLDRLAAALQADPQHGLAGPSTNRAWNEQGVFPNARGDAAAIIRTSTEAAQRFGDTWRTLEPLYSLSDFCYAVRREVIAAVGRADEQYGLGPCWEMDYNLRAARAGWRGVWACSAYVYRAPFTSRRQRAERLYFEASKRRYQDKFCGLRLRGEKPGYEAHCRGEACEHFAPSELIQITANTLQPDQSTLLSVTSPVSAEPLVSCIMPTYNRREFIPRAIEYFLRQDYANKELIIVDDGTDPIGDLVPADARLRYIRLSERHSIGAKRNRACEAAQGDIICHWDDDDWHAPQRLTYQAQALQSEKASVCGINHLLFFDPLNQRAWQYVYPPQQRFWVAGSSLCYTRSFWAAHPFADVNVGEDARFVWSDPRARMMALSDYTFHVGLIHPHNVSPKRTNGTYWTPLDVREIQRVLGVDYEQYQTQAVSIDVPLVSCIMPTYNRRAFVPLAVQHFQRQTYAPRELIIMDDGTDPIEDLVQGLPNVQYIRLKQRTSIGAKRNLACRTARGEFIAQWDDDDWYAPDRLSYQLAPLLSGEADLSGLENTYLLTLPAGEFWTVQSTLHRRMFVGDVHGGTLVFRKALFNEGLRYPEVNLAEDAGLLQQALRRGKRLARLSNAGLFVYMRHGHNAWQFKTGQFLDPTGWRKIDQPAAFPHATLAAYQAAAQRAAL